MRGSGLPTTGGCASPASPRTAEAVPWSAWGEVVASAEQVERAGDTDRALDRLGLPTDSPACTPPSLVGGA